ncbi:MAG: alkaline phosphatase family protein, partial [Vicinamibacteria bacterium]
MRLLLATVTTLLLAGRPLEAESPPPTLVLFLSIDQCRADYLERFRPVLEGGLLRLLEQGAVFADTHHDHAVTITAPGHAALSTGLFPSHSGIVGNDWFDRSEKREVYCVEDREAPILLARERSGPRPASLGRSPRNLLGEGIGDWMKRNSSRSKVYAVAGKDRSAVLMGGKKADAAFWYDGESGDWVTSRYYLDEYAAWVRRFHARRLADGSFGRNWEPLPVTDALLSSMAIEATGEGAEDSGIPKTIGRGALSEDAGFYHALFETPFI